MAKGALEAAVDRLYAAPLQEFVAERSRIVRELSAGSDTATAEQVAKLRKPSAAAWALNQIAREDPDVVEEWCAAAADLRHASQHPAEVGGDGLRAAMAAHRAATTHLVDAVRERARSDERPLSEAMLDRVRTLLQSATADAQLAQRLQAARVSEDEALADAALAPKPTGRRTTSKRPQPAPATPDRETEARAEQRAEAQRHLRAAKDVARRERKEVARRQAAARSADQRLEKARQALQRLESEAAGARAALEQAENAAAAAEDELGRLQRAR